MNSFAVFFALLRYEFRNSLRGPLFWLAMFFLLFLSLPVHMAYGGEIVIMGHAVGQTYRMAVATVAGYSMLLFLSTLYSLCLCLDRAGSQYLKNNDVLILARAVGRLSFCTAKIAAVFLNAMLYATLGLLWLWEELFRVGAENTGRLFFLLLPLALTVACIITVYFSLRNFLGNFLIFFLWLIALPVFFITGLWHYYSDGLNGSFRFLLWLPQMGGLHAWALGTIHSALERPQTSWALLNVVCWMVATLILGSVVFLRKRL